MTSSWYEWHNQPVSSTSLSAIWPTPWSFTGLSNGSIVTTPGDSLTHYESSPAPCARTTGCTLPFSVNLDLTDNVLNRRSYFGQISDQKWQDWNVAVAWSRDPRWTIMARTSMIDRQHNLSIAPNITTLSSGNELTRTHLVITTIHDGAKCSAVNLILDETRISPIRCVISTMHNLIRMSCGPSYILMPVHLPNAWYLQPKPLSLSLSLSIICLLPPYRMTEALCMLMDIPFICWILILACLKKSYCSSFVRQISHFQLNYSYDLL